jgi:hypothetical protein
VNRFAVASATTIDWSTQTSARLVTFSLSMRRIIYLWWLNHPQAHEQGEIFFCKNGRNHRWTKQEDAYFFSSSCLFIGTQSHRRLFFALKPYYWAVRPYGLWGFLSFSGLLCPSGKEAQTKRLRKTRPRSISPTLLAQLRGAGSSEYKSISTRAPVEPPASVFSIRTA